MTVAVGDVIELRLPEGYVYGLVVLCPPAYPPAIAFLHTVSPEPMSDPADLLHRCETVTALVPLPSGENDRLRIVERGLGVPAVRFQVPVRDRTGRILYRWEWDGQSIELGDETESRDLPVRHIQALGDLVAFLHDAQTKRLEIWR